jgi:hypothetical protein
LSAKAKNSITLSYHLKKRNNGVFGRLIRSILLSSAVGFASWWISKSFEFAIISWILSSLALHAISSARNWKRHFLIANDQQGFMKTLKLSEKTAIFDGSNIYHFGIENSVGKWALEILVQELRSDGFSIVCFFDANIYFTLLEYGEIQNNTVKFSPNILKRIFGLDESEIYVVPSGIQADRFVLESLSHLQISFAVTNDKYRDYEGKYSFLSEDFRWRKGVKIDAGRLHLYQHKFKNPLAVQYR